jgi:hypothetical protein
MHHAALAFTGLMILAWLVAAPSPAMDPVPQVDGEWWSISDVPDLGEFNKTNAQGEFEQFPIDFCVWQARDGSWQEQACIRNCDSTTGVKRLLYRWSDDHITNAHWATNGIDMLPDTSYGETLGGGLTSPHVLRDDDGMYYMVYGGGAGICLADSTDGIHFTRHTNASGTSVIITAPDDPPNTWPRDPCLVKHGATYYCYYAVSGKQSPLVAGAVIGRWSTNVHDWSASTNTIVCQGGVAGGNPWSAECPHVVRRFGKFYLLRSGQNSDTYVYCSGNPLYFGVYDDSLLLTNFQASYGSKLDGVEIVRHHDRDYIGALNDHSLARLTWAATGGPPRNPSVYINDGAATVTSVNVELTLYAEAPAPVAMMIADGPDFAGAAWTDYVYRCAWTLPPPVFADKTVYVTYRASDGSESLPASNTVHLVPEPAGLPAAILAAAICLARPSRAS